MSVELSCIKCGNCCRVGGVCDWRGWMRVPGVISWNDLYEILAFTGVCEYLREDNLCDVVVKARAGEIPGLDPTAIASLDKIICGICSRPDLRKLLEKVKR